MVSKSTETDEEVEETVEDLLDDEEGEPKYEPDFTEIIAIRQYALEAAMDFWGQKVTLSLAADDKDSLTFPIHVSTIIDTAMHIEKFLRGDFPSVV